MREGNDIRKNTDHNKKTVVYLCSTEIKYEIKKGLHLIEYDKEVIHTMVGKKKENTVNELNDQ